MALGSTTQARAAPPRNSGTAAARNPIEDLRSRVVRPGVMKAQSGYSQTGEAITKPITMAVWICRLNAPATLLKLIEAVTPRSRWMSMIGLAAASKTGPYRYQPPPPPGREAVADRPKRWR